MKLSNFSLLLLTSCLLLHSCLKKTPGEPPSTANYDPYLACNDSLADLNYKALSVGGGTTVGWRVLGDTTVYGIVVGDDRSGNIYKKIIIEDSFGGGMTVVIDRTYLYADFPVGRKVYLKLNGLYLVNYKGTPEIVYSVNSDATTNGIPSALIGNYIIKASYPHTIAPKLVTFANLTTAYKYCNTLVRLDSMQFDDASAGQLYSFPNVNTNRSIQRLCATTNKLTMYNSSYANFQPYTTPTGEGSIVGLISIYGSGAQSAQFVLRDTTDIVFNNPRCQ